MKKIFVLFTVICFSVCCFSVTSQAAHYSGTHTQATVNGNEHSFVENEYFSANYDSLFESGYDYASFFAQCNSSQSAYVYPLIDFSAAERDDFEGYYIMILFDESQKNDNMSYADFNTMMLNGIKDLIADVVYIGNTTPFVVAVSDLSEDKFDKLINTDIVAGVLDAFCFSPNTSVHNDSVFSPSLLAPTAADARRVLRVAAGIETVEQYAKAFYCYYDFNLDNRITAADARLVLRASAQLDEPNEFVGEYSDVWLHDIA